MYDGEFLAGYAPEFCSVVNGQKLSTNSIPDINQQTEIPFGFVKNGGSDYRIEVSGVETMHERVYLQDLKTGIVADLNLYPVYAFTSAEGDTPGRFLLKFGNVGTGSHDPGNLRVCYNQHQLFVTNNSGNAQIEVFNIAGQQVYSGNTDHNPVQINLPDGIYFARVTDNYQSLTVKFLAGQ